MYNIYIYSHITILYLYIWYAHDSFIDIPPDNARIEAYALTCRCYCYVCFLLFQLSGAGVLKDKVGLAIVES